MMTEEKIYSQIKNKISQIASVPDEEMKKFLSLCKKASYKKNEYFTEVGDKQVHVAYIINGLFRLFYIDMEGKEYTKNFISQDNFVMAYNSMLKGEPSNLYIQALRDSEVFLINYNEWQKLAETQICWQIVFRKMTEHEYLQKEKRESDLLFFDAETRYLNFKKEFPGLEKEIKQYHLASFLGMSPETLCRIKK